MSKPISYVYQGKEDGQTNFYKQDKNHNLNSIIDIGPREHPDPFKFYLQYFHRGTISIRNEVPDELPESLEAEDLKPLSPEQMISIYAQIAMSE